MRPEAVASENEEFGRRVRAARMALAVDGGLMSQERLAVIVGVHRTYVGRVERGEVSPVLHNIIRLAAALQVDPADLVRGLRPSAD